MNLTGETMPQDFECIEKLMVNEELYRETLLHIPGSPHIPYLGTAPCYSFVLFFGDS
jgi:hypothetical protein